MKYEFLKNLYYKDQEPFITEYGKRFNSDCAFHLNININGNEAFFLRIPDIYEMIVKIVKTDSRLYDLYMHLPGVAITQYILKSLRACLVSFENNADKSQGNHLERILQNSFTIFPKSTTLIEPTKRTFTIQRFGITEKVCSSLRFTISTSAFETLFISSAKFCPV